jgi:uncharacterized protein
MEYSFSAFGHPHIRATHRTTLEFTKDSDLTLEGDCIVGVKADFDPSKLREFVKSCGDSRMKMTIHVPFGRKVLEEAMECRPNTLFNDAHEVVVRKTDFRSGRTLGMHADKAASDMSREIAELLRNPAQKIDVLLEKL